MFAVSLPVVFVSSFSNQHLRGRASRRTSVVQEIWAQKQIFEARYFKDCEMWDISSRSCFPQ